MPATLNQYSVFIYICYAVLFRLGFRSKMKKDTDEDHDDEVEDRGREKEKDKKKKDTKKKDHARLGCPTNFRF